MLFIARDYWKFKLGKPAKYSYLYFFTVGHASYGYERKLPNYYRSQTPVEMAFVF